MNPTTDSIIAEHPPQPHQEHGAEESSVRSLTDEARLLNKLIGDGMEYYQARDTIKAIREYGNVDTLQVYFLPAERRRKWFVCNQDGTGFRTFRAYAKDCLRDAGHTAKSAELILRVSHFDPIDVSDLVPV
jgi:hypothetical protein